MNQRIMTQHIMNVSTDGTGTIGKPKGLNEKQTEALKFVNAFFTGLAMEGTSVSWEIDLEHPTDP